MTDSSPERDTATSLPSAFSTDLRLCTRTEPADLTWIWSTAAARDAGEVEDARHLDDVLAVGLERPCEHDHQLARGQR